MRWGTLWLTAVMIAATSAVYNTGVVTVENIPDLDPSTPKNGMIGEVPGDPSASSPSTPSSENPPTTITDESEVTPDNETSDPTNETPSNNENSNPTTETPSNNESSEPATETPSNNESSSPSTPSSETPSTSTTDESVVTPDNETSDPTNETPSTNENSNPTTDNLPDSDTTTEPPNEELIVTTNSGKVQGFVWKGDIISYIDIPYGNFGTKHFEAATAADPWEMHSVRDHYKRCPQYQDNKFHVNVDCLTLSIFKPLNAENASVLFYIHGDDFKTGSGDPSIYGPEYLVNNEIILVLPNYRLGPLGFLCLQNETAPGNMALKDLSLALSWIHDNIQFFGGDPDNIAVSGDGRSGALAELLALSPMSKDHVDKVITESGSLLSHWVLDRDPKSTVADFFDKIQEADKSIKSRIDISLEDLDLITILKAANEIEFRPCLEAEDDDSFMTKSPYAMIKTNKIDTTFLMGSAMYAGLHEALHHTKDSIKELNEDFTLLLPNDLKFPTETSKAEIGGRVKRQYFGDENITLDNVQNISLYFTDVGYLGPGIRSARLLAKAGATVYFYEFSFVGEFNRMSESLNSSLEGAVRGDIVGYLFTQHGHVPDAEERDTDDTKMIYTLTEMWTNFLTKGYPGTETIDWNKLENENHDEEEWLLIDSDEPSMQKGLHVDRLPLWTSIYEEHFIEGENHARGLSPSVLTVLIFQLVFWLVFCTNVSHVF